MTRAPGDSDEFDDAQLIDFLHGVAEEEVAARITAALDLRPELLERLQRLDPGLPAVLDSMNRLLQEAPRAELTNALVDAAVAVSSKASDTSIGRGRGKRQVTATRWSAASWLAIAVVVASAFAAGFYTGGAGPTGRQPITHEAASDVDGGGQKRQLTQAEPAGPPAPPIPTVPPAQVPADNSLADGAKPGVAAAPTSVGPPMPEMPAVAVPSDSATGPSSPLLASTPPPDATPSRTDSAAAAAPSVASVPDAPASADAPSTGAAKPEIAAAPASTEPPVSDGTAVAIPKDPTTGPSSPALASAPPLPTQDAAALQAPAGPANVAPTTEGAGPNSGATAWVQAVASYVRLMTSETLEQTGQSRGEIRARLAAMSQRFGVDMEAVQRSVGNLALKRVDILQLNGRPLLQLGFVDADGNPLAVCIILRAGGGPGKESPVAPRFRSEDAMGLNAVHWDRQPLGFLVIGRGSSSRMLDAAQRINRAVRPS